MDDLHRWQEVRRKLLVANETEPPLTAEEQNELWEERRILFKRIYPLLEKEFDALQKGMLTDSVKRLLQDSVTTDFGSTRLAEKIAGFPESAQQTLIPELFTVLSDEQLGQVLLCFILKTTCCRKMFHLPRIQNWIVQAINTGLPAGPLYFALSCESADAVVKTAEKTMRTYHKDSYRARSILDPLLCAAFLASHGKTSGIRFLNDQMKHRTVEARGDLLWLFPAIGLSGNRELIARCMEIIATDRREKWYGEDCIPQKGTFAHEAALAASFTVEGFPPVDPYEFTPEQKASVLDWIQKHPDWKLKKEPGLYELFYWNGRLNTFVPGYFNDLRTWNQNHQFENSDSEQPSP